MGWRSWNGVGDASDQALLEQMVEGLLRVGPGGKSLWDLGYRFVAQDDGWQDCGAGVNGSWHGPGGEVLLNKTKFPSLAEFTQRSRDKGVEVMWYLSTDGCCERGKVGPYPEQDVGFLVENGLSGAKFDNCGPLNNITEWADVANATGVSLLLENCNNDESFRANPSNTPSNYFRAGSDISPSWPTISWNLMQHNEWLWASRPRGWSFPDMLVVGTPFPHTPTLCPTPQLSVEEAKGHFAAWCVTSSPLILGHDLSNASEFLKWWPVVGNTEAIAINQAWAGEAGRLVMASPQNVTMQVFAGRECEANHTAQLPTFTVWAKTLPEGQAAVAINTLSAPVSLTVPFEALKLQGTVTATDVWSKQQETIQDQWRVTLPPRGSKFVKFVPKTDAEYGR